MGGFGTDCCCRKVPGARGLGGSIIGVGPSGGIFAGPLGGGGLGFGFPDAVRCRAEFGRFFAGLPFLETDPDAVEPSTETSSGCPTSATPKSASSKSPPTKHQHLVLQSDGLGLTIKFICLYKFGSFKKQLVSTQAYFVFTPTSACFARCPRSVLYGSFFLYRSMVRVSM